MAGIGGPGIGWKREYPQSRVRWPGAGFPLAALTASCGGADADSELERKCISPRARNNLNERCVLRRCRGEQRRRTVRADSRAWACGGNTFSALPRCCARLCARMVRPVMPRLRPARRRPPSRCQQLECHRRPCIVARCQHRKRGAIRQRAHRDGASRDEQVQRELPLSERFEHFTNACAGSSARVRHEAGRIALDDQHLVAERKSGCRRLHKCE